MEIIPSTNYPGRKGASGTWQKILSEIPRCDLFIDAMTGSGLIASLVKGCEVILNDVDPEVLKKIAVVGSSSRCRKYNLPYQEIIAQYDRGHRSTVFYFDPPYHFDSRNSTENIYQYEWTNEDHELFLHRVGFIASSVMISHYPHPLYDQVLKNWRKLQYTTMTRGGARLENLYMNFEQPALLQCYDHVGENFTDRQRIKRKIDRLMKRLVNEHPKERAAILSAVAAKFDNAKS